MKIYSGPLSMFGAKVEIAAHEKGIAFELEMVPFDMQRLYEPRHPEVLRVNPKRQVPVLIDGPLEIFDSTQIFEYLEHRFPAPPLWPEGPQDRAQARLLELKSDEVFFAHVIRLMPIQRNREHPDWSPSRAGIEAYYAAMEGALADRERLSGPFSYADIAFYMAQFFAARMGVPMTSALPRLTAWRLRMAARPAVDRVVGAMTAYLTSIGRPPPVYV
jgi:glutathione S-transferase